MSDLKELIGKQFKCTDPHFEGCIGTITNAWYEDYSWDIIHLYVKGEDFRGTFFFDEGHIV